MKILFLLFFSVTAFSQDNCNAILAKGVFNSFKYDGDIKKKDALIKYYCSSRERSHSSTNSSSGDDGLGLNVFEVFDFGFDSDRSSNGSVSNLSKDELCMSSDSNHESSAVQHLLFQQADANIVDAWKTCMAESNKKLICIGKMIDEDSFQFSVEYKYGAGKLKNVQLDTHGLTKVAGREPRRMSPGTYQFYFKLNNKYQGSALVLQGEGTYKHFSCNYSIPKIERQEDLDKKRNNHLCESLRTFGMKNDFYNLIEYQVYKEHNLYPVFTHKYGRTQLAGLGYCNN